MNYIPKISIAIFIEVFSFFFLRLYRNSLIDIKYYQNELTNIEFKIVGIKIGFFIDEKDLLKNIANEILKVERNFIVKSDENITTTLTANNENSSDRHYTDNLKGVIDSISNLVSKK